MIVVGKVLDYRLIHKTDDDSRVVINDEEEELLKFDYSLNVIAYRKQIGSLHGDSKGWVFTDSSGKEFHTEIACNDYHWKQIEQAELRTAWYLLKVDQSKLQEWFDKAYIGVIKQGGVSTRGLAGCAYRGANGRKCGVGHLIPDEDYTPQMDGGIFQSICVEELIDSVDYNMGKILGVPNPSIYKVFLDEIQKSHDIASYDVDDTIGTYKRNMDSIAKNFKLTVPTI